jgi:hypothetical protein
MKVVPSFQAAIDLPSIYDDVFDSADTRASVQTFRKSLHAISEPGERFEACIEMRNRLLDRYSTQQQHFELLFESIDTIMHEECPRYSVQKLLWSASPDTTDENLQRWKRFIDVVEKGRDLKKQCFPPLNKTGNMWGDDKVLHYGWALTSYRFCKFIGQVAAKKSWEEAVTKLNQLIARRIAKGRVKDSANPIEQVDLQDLQAWDGASTFIKTGTKGQELYSVENATISLGDLPKGYGLDRYGLVVRKKFAVSPKSSLLASPLSSPVSMPALSLDTTPSNLPDAALVQTPVSEGEDKDDEERNSPSLTRTVTSEHARARGGVAANVSEGKDKDSEEQNPGSRAYTAAGKRARDDGNGDGKKKQKVRTQGAADIANWERQCRCDQADNAIPDAIRENIINLESTATLHKTADELAAARQAAVGVALSIGNMNVCHSHCFIFATHVGIYKASMQHAQLLRIVLHYGQQADIGTYLASDEAALLIKKRYREPNPHDDAGIVQIIAPPQPPMYNLNKQIAADIIEEMFPGMKDIWERDGDVVSDIFGWIFQDETLVNYIEAEVDMYDYHFRPKAGQSKKGWLRNANFTQIQQLIRMDLVFYAQHVLLHEEHAVRFISYPYEMKLAMLGMSTAFSHLDLNVARVIDDLDGRTEYPVRKYIQTAVALTNEDKRNCTKIIPKMHKEAIFRDWAKNQPNNKNAINAGVVFTEDHAKKYDTRFRYDILKAGESRISDPRCLHGTDGPATKRRVAVFAWLVEHNGQSLQQPGTGSVEELGRAHRDLLLGPKLNSPSGYPNKTGIPIEKFPASMQLLSPSAISNAIVGRISYSDVSVQSELAVLFGDDIDKRVKLIDNTRKRMLAQVKKNYNHLFKLEEEMFGEKSFCRNKHIFEKSCHLQRHAVPTFPEELEIANFIAKKKKIDRMLAREKAGASTSEAEEEEKEGEDAQAHGSDTESDGSQGESMSARVANLGTDTLLDADKRHPNNKYRHLGATIK